MGFWKSDPTPKNVGNQPVSKRTIKRRAKVSQIKSSQDAWLKAQVTGKRGKRIFDGTHDDEKITWEETVDSKGNVTRRSLR